MRMRLCVGCGGAESFPSVPVFEPPDDLLEENDSVGDGLVPLHLEQRVVAVLGGQSSSAAPTAVSSPQTRLPGGLSLLSLGLQPQSLTGPHGLPALPWLHCHKYIER